MDLTKTITTYNRGYPSTELMLKTIKLNSYFIIRAKVTNFKKQQKTNGTRKNKRCNI